MHLQRGSTASGRSGAFLTLTALALAAAVACSDDSEPAGPQSVEELRGPYTLIGVDGEPLPDTLMAGFTCTTEDGDPGAGTLEIVSGTMDILTGYDIRIFYLNSCDGFVTLTSVMDTGELDLDDGSVIFRSGFPEGEILLGIADVSGDRITLTLADGWDGRDLESFTFEWGAP